MQISKTFLAVGAVMFCAVFLAFAAPDNWAQAKAREALQKKINELEAGQPGAQSPAAVAPSIAPTTQPAVASDQTVRAREALRQKVDELDAQKPVAATPVVPAPVVKSPPQAPKPAKSPKTTRVQKSVPGTKPAETPARTATTPASTVAVTPPVATAPLNHASPEEVARQREALRQKIAELEAGKAAATPSPTTTIARPQTAPPESTAVVAPARKSAKEIRAEKAAAAEKKRLADDAKAREAEQQAAAAEAKAREEQRAKTKSSFVLPARPAFAPLEAPPPAISASKEARLAELLRQYMADVITPEEYHKQRAKILAEP